ncbi:hypothetical protein ABZ260_45890, partial [Streptosporangium sp. NPDC006013]|uniref:hypothetical protein n=1 Tax=Streptosporangium sp. NPDC006013 TaxID=3155596 RepID=UPI0033BDB7B2
AGCVRLAPPELAPRFQTRRHLGGREYADMLATAGRRRLARHRAAFAHPGLASRTPVRGTR